METRVSPRRGQALMISGGWENAHYVDAVREGVRFAVPAFFNTLPTRGPPLWQEGDEVGQARALFDCGILPSSAAAILEFKQHWGRMFS